MKFVGTLVYANIALKQLPTTVWLCVARILTTKKSKNNEWNEKQIRIIYHDGSNGGYG